MGVPVSVSSSWLSFLSVNGASGEEGYARSRGFCLVLCSCRRVTKIDSAFGPGTRTVQWGMRALNSIFPISAQRVWSLLIPVFSTDSTYIVFTFFLTSSVVYPMGGTLTLSSTTLHSKIPSLPGATSGYTSASGVFDSFSLVVFFL